MGDKFDITEYSFAKDVLEDYPKIFDIYEKAISDLYKYGYYTGVWHTIQAIEESKMMLLIQYDHYKQVYKKKGKINER